MKVISKISILFILLFFSVSAYSQCEPYKQKAETLFAEKKYEDAKKQYLIYKECNPNVQGIDAKIAECDRLIQGGVPIPQGTPDIETIKKCLIGKKIQDKHGGYFENRGGGVYFGTAWTWTIETNDIKSIEIKKSDKKGNDFLIDIRLLLQGKSSPTQYIFDLQVLLIMNEKNNWIVDNIVTQDIYLVKTGRYDHCLAIETVENNRGGHVIFGSTGTTLNVTNNCNVALVVCGQVLNDGKWGKFHIYIEANQYNQSLHLQSSEYKIDFIEKK